MKQKQVDTLAAIEDQKKQIESSRATLETKQNNLFTTIKKLKAKDSSLASLESEVKQTLAAEAAKSKALEQKANSVPTSLKHVEGKTITVTSTAYTASCKGCSGVTATGINLKDKPDSKVIAVDPSVIPLGSVVYVEGYGYAIAGDIGSAIKGKKIDVFVPTRAKALQWGVRKVNVTIQ
ncbi:3D domain-containing protein [Ornithinibacillus scapharcae]|uniref:3D domain-containing protein n=1 Tax=Ornithinibacillus scapharcae TaxID=1147159 RepID=UPI000225B8FC|nr:3D domain-containing protein [Ornithinibacillus scapharcae]